ncbi:MAG: hypothetical protein HY782_02945 [Chloroflexi bacterium]|nr:hypothetical protein [Chloroflexota bacterium]
MLRARPDPLDVLKTTAFVVEHARAVKIHGDAIERAADALAEKQVTPPAWNYEYHFHDGTPRTVNYLFLLDALNFCFWGQPRWQIEYQGKTLDGYWALAAALKRAVEQKPEIADAEFLASISPQQLQEILQGRGEIPLFAERWRNVRELGVTLRNLWEGEAARLVECANHDAARLAQMIAENFSSFNDIAVYEREVRFFKRAQILVTDLWGAFRGQDWGEFENINALTAFADYKLPQILRAWGVLRYSPALARKVDRKIQLAAGSAEEIEIRAATLWAVEFLRQALAARGRDLWSTQVDWILWEASQAKFAGIKPYHRVRTIYY